MGIRVREVFNPVISKSLKMFSMVQSPVENEAANAASHLNRYVINHNINISHFVRYIDPPNDFFPVYDRYKYLLTKTRQTVDKNSSVLTAQELREKILRDAKKAFEDALSEFTGSKEVIEKTDHVYRWYLNAEYRTRKTRSHA